MKRSLITERTKRTLLAVSASALMLGASQAQTSVGINFSASYYGGGNYASTAVTDVAFGVPAADWTSTVLDDTNDSLTVTPSGGGSFAVSWSASGSDISWASPSYMPGYAGYPGDSEVFDGNITGPYTVTLSGLAVQFPHGYAVQPVAAANQPSSGMLPLIVTDDKTTNTLDYTGLGEFVGGGFGSGGGTFGYYSPTTTLFTNDILTMYGPTNEPNENANWLSGFIITDKPVISVQPVNTALVSGNTLSLVASVVGVEPLHYQWRTNGVPINGANSPRYSMPDATVADNGNYDLVVTNSVGSITSFVSVVSISVPAMLTYDANPGTSGAELDGSGTWDATTTNWWNGSGDVAWTPFSFATFGAGIAGGYTVTLATNVSASGLTFDSESYTIANTSSETITMVSPAEITVNNDATISAPLAGTVGLVIDGAGTLTLSAQNTYTGTTTVSNGTLNLPTAYTGANSALVSPVINLEPGTSLTCDYGAFGWYANNNPSGLTINATGATCQPNGAFGVAYTLTGGNISGGSMRLDLGASAGFNAFVTTYPSSTTSVINPGGGSLMLRNDSGQATYVFTTAAGTTPTGVDLDIQVPINQNTAPCSVVKAGSGTLQLSAANTYAGTTTVSNGTLLVSGALGTGAVEIKAGATLGGAGTIGGTVTVDGTLSSGTNNPGALTIDNALTLDADSTTMLAIDRAAGTASYGSVQGITTATFGGTLLVTNLGGAFQSGDTFTLFNAGTYAGNFAATIFPPLNSGLGWNWSSASGTLTVVPVVTNPDPTNIVVTVGSGGLTMSWPVDHIGWRLLVQTNNLAAGVSTNVNDWTPVAGSAVTNQVFISIDVTKPAEFYRLVYP